MLYGIGIGIGYPILLIVSLRWFPNKRHYGLIGGFISCIFGGVAIIFDLIETKLVNPMNVTINKLNIDNIPTMFVYVGLSMFSIALLLIKNPPWYKCEVRINATSKITRKSDSQINFERNSLNIKQVIKLTLLAIMIK